MPEPGHEPTLKAIQHRASRIKHPVTSIQQKYLDKIQQKGYNTNRSNFKFTELFMYAKEVAKCGRFLG
jgi:hypothetical protein